MNPQIFFLKETSSFQYSWSPNYRFHTRQHSSLASPWSYSVLYPFRNYCSILPGSFGVNNSALKLIEIEWPAFRITRGPI